jgi:hypothetical protein
MVSVICAIAPQTPICQPATPAPAPAPAPVPQVSEQQIVEQKVIEQATELDYPAIEILTSPLPSDNKWNMLAVNLPIWFYHQAPTTLSTTIEKHGYTFTLTGELDYLSIDVDSVTGETIHCESVQKLLYQYQEMTESPVCGYTYRKRVEQATPTGFAYWDITWTTNTGLTGAIQDQPQPITGPTYKVGEIESLLIYDPEYWDNICYYGRCDQP